MLRLNFKYLLLHVFSINWVSLVENWARMEYTSKLIYCCNILGYPLSSILICVSREAEQSRIIEISQIT